MAVPDWPLSFGSLNPDGWWADFPVRLEHGHRLFASIVGLLATIQCAWIWRNFWPLLWALIASLALSVIAHLIGVAPIIAMHVSIWSFAGAFAVALLSGSFTSTAAPAPKLLRGLAFAAFLGVCLQATFGGLRVTLETAGNLPAAQVLRIVHGCVAQAEVCLLVAIATMVSARWNGVVAAPSSLLPRRLAWWTVGLVYLQLIVGATMRHLGAGLAIPTFPQASPSGSWLPPAHNLYIDANFTHTRLGALLVGIFVVTLAVSTLRHARGKRRLTQPAWALLALLAIQITLGILVIWYTKPRTLTTIHVVNGAILLATALLLALRLQRFAPSSSNPRPPHLDEAAGLPVLEGTAALHPSRP
jgi:cytochrome c oxidase assembly protein subunit 15